MVMKLVPSHEGITEADGVREWVLRKIFGPMKEEV
jgi:hypothetical protein